MEGASEPSLGASWLGAGAGRPCKGARRERPSRAPLPLGETGALRAPATCAGRPSRAPLPLGEADRG